MRRFVPEICAVSSEEVAKDVLAKNFNLNWAKFFGDEFSENFYGGQ